jgi:hypothetical protein
MTPMRRLAPLLPALAALAVLVPAAHAKELMALKACGPDGCRDVDDPSRLVGGVIEGDPGEPPSGAAPFMRLRIGVGDGERVITRFTTTFVPAAGLMQAEDGSWLRPDAATVSALRELARGQRLFPASALRLPALPRAEAPAPPAADAADAAGDGLPGWLIAMGAALLAGLALVPIVLARRASAG